MALNRRKKRRMAIQAARKAARDYLGCRTGKFLRKLNRGDADAQMAFCSAAQDVAEADGFDFDVDLIMELLKLILAFIEMFGGFFSW